MGSWVVRSLQKRPLVFYLPEDVHVLKKEDEPGLNLERSKTHRKGGFESVGKDENAGDSRYSIESLQSYDEMALASMITVSVATPFFNDGSRYNMGAPGRCQGTDDNSDLKTA